MIHVALLDEVVLLLPLVQLTLLTFLAVVLLQIPLVEALTVRTNPKRAKHEHSND